MQTVRYVNYNAYVSLAVFPLPTGKTDYIALGILSVHNDILMRFL